MNTYPDSAMFADALLAIANSYYHEGGTENLVMAEDVYKNFIVLFPTNPKAQDAELKIIALNAKMMDGPDSDQSYAHKTEEAARSFLGTIPIVIMPQS
jgi:outer membrane protein assembly factor BamD